MSNYTPYIDHITDLNGNVLYLRDKKAQEDLVHKTEKTVRGTPGLPTNPGNYDEWLAMEKFIYYIPVAGVADKYEAWTLFFMGDPSVASDYNNPNNYEWVLLDVTESDLNNFSTKGHTHEVIPETEVGDHEFTPQGEVRSSFHGTGATIQGGSHSHNFTPEGSVSGSIDGTREQTESAQTGVSLSKTGVDLSTKKLHVQPATAVDFTGSTTNGNRATGGLTTQAANTYNNDTLLHGFHVEGTGLVFDKVTLDKANDTVTNLQASIAASKVMIDNSDTTVVEGQDVGQDFATGAVDTGGDQLLGYGTGISDNGHKHYFTPHGDFSATLQASQQETEAATHTHDYTPAGRVDSGFEGVKINLKHKVDNKKVRTAPDSEDEGSHAFDWYGIEFDEDESNPEKTRVGNRDMHRMLPIQTKMRRCLLNDDGTVNYYLDSNDSTKRAGSQEGYVTSEETFMSKVETDEIRAATEEIGVIKGNTGELNQLVQNGNFVDTSNWEAKQGTLSVSGGKGIFTLTAEQSSARIQQAITGYSNHKYYVCATVKSSKFTAVRIGSDVDPAAVSYDLSSNEQKRISGVFTSTGNFALMYFYCNSYAYLSVGDTIEYSNINLFDLTLMGIDSFTTAEQVEAYLAKNFGQRSYYPYNAGTLLSNTMKGIQTVGFNKWDEEWEKGYFYDSNGNISYSENTSTCIRSKNYIPVLPNTTYNFHSGTGYAYKRAEFDSNGNYIGGAKTGNASSNYTFTTSANTHFIKIMTEYYGTTYNHDICINISDPAKNGTYEPYNLHSYQRDVTQITGVNPNTGVRELVAPNGLQKADMAGTVIDSIYNDVNGNAVCKKMCGDVDMGSLSWASDGNNYAATVTSLGFRTWSSGYPLGRGLLSSRYINTQASVWNSMSDGEIGASTTVLEIRDSSISSSDIDSQGKISKLSGAMLVYELATPILYTDLQWGDGSPVILPIEIEAEKNSTIKIVPPHGDGGEELLMAAPTLQMKKYVLTQGANLDGSDGQVMVEIPEHWRKVYRYTSGGHSYMRAMLSPYPQDTTGWIHVKQSYISAYEACIDSNDKLCSVSDVKDLVLSVVDGKVNATCDVSVATGQSDITSKLPTTNETMATFRTAARARGNVGEAMWNMLVYEQYIDLYWLYVIEYANLNCQAAFTTVLDNEGFHQGGLGDGATTVSSGNWNTFNSYKPFVPCGITNCLGNQSGEVLLALPSTFGTNAKIPVASYRGVENPFGHIWKFADGIKYVGDGTQQDIRRCDNPADYSSESSTTNYPSIGNNYGDNGWKKKIVVGDDGDINCDAVGAGNLSYYCDYNYQAHANGTYYCCLLGGDAYSGSSAGLASVYSSSGVAYSNSCIGSRLCFFNK